MTNGWATGIRMLAAGAVLLLLPAAGPAGAASCLDTAGGRASNRYVEDCLSVSAATHPPCNAENSCAMILGEIERSCAQIDDGDPGSRVCRRYR